MITLANIYIFIALYLASRTACSVSTAVPGTRTPSSPMSKRRSGRVQRQSLIGSPRTPSRCLWSHTSSNYPCCSGLFSSNVCNYFTGEFKEIECFIRIFCKQNWYQKPVVNSNFTMFLFSQLSQGVRCCGNYGSVMLVKRRFKTLGQNSTRRRQFSQKLEMKTLYPSTILSNIISEYYTIVYPSTILQYIRVLYYSIF